MKIRDIAVEVTKREGKKKNQNIAEVSEMLGIVSDIIVKSPKALAALLNNGVRRAKLLLVFGLLGVLVTGCASTDMATGAAKDAAAKSGGAFGVAEKFASPEQKAALKQIKELLVGRTVNPLDGFERTITYKYKGEPIEPDDLSREIVWKKREAINDSLYQAKGGQELPLEADQALVDEIGKILDAAGVK